MSIITWDPWFLQYICYYYEASSFHEGCHYLQVALTILSQLMLHAADWIWKQHTKSLIWYHKTLLHSQSNHGCYYWIFYISLSNYNGRLRIIQHVMLTSAPYSCSIWKYPAEKDRQEKTDMVGERPRMTCEFLLAFFVSKWNHVKLWQKCDTYLQCQKNSGVTHSLICQVRQCFGSVGGLVRLCVLVFLCTCDLKWMCIMHRHPVFVCLSLHLPVSSACHSSINKEKLFLNLFAVLKICHAFLKQGKWTERETENCRKSGILSHLTGNAVHRMLQSLC